MTEVYNLLQMKMLNL